MPLQYFDPEADSGDVVEALRRDGAPAVPSVNDHSWPKARSCAAQRMAGFGVECRVQETRPR